MDAEIRIVTESERPASVEPARVLIYFGDRLISTVVSKIEYEKGADGRFYPCIKQNKTDV